MVTHPLTRLLLSPSTADAQPRQPPSFEITAFPQAIVLVSCNPCPPNLSSKGPLKCCPRPGGRSHGHGGYDSIYKGGDHCNHPRLNFHWLFRAPGIGSKLLAWHSEHQGLIPTGKARGRRRGRLQISYTTTITITNHTAEYLRQGWALHTSSH